MVRPSRNQDEATFQRLARVKQSAPPPVAALGAEMLAFFKQSVEKRQTKLAKIAECWGALVPETLNDHCALESLSRGTLTVIVRIGGGATLRKLPHVTALFWAIKIVAVTLGAPCGAPRRCAACSSCWSATRPTGSDH